LYSVKLKAITPEIDHKDIIVALTKKEISSALVPLIKNQEQIKINNAVNCIFSIILFSKRYNKSFKKTPKAALFNSRSLYFL